jgi:hypothetical protein
MKIPITGQGEPIDEHVRAFIRSSIARSYDVKSMEFQDNAILIEFHEEVPEHQIRELVKQLLYVSRSLANDVLFDKRITLDYRENPMPMLESRGDIRKVADGMYMMQGTFLKLFRFFDRCVKQMADKYGAIEQEYPVLWPVELYRTINYFKEFPQQVILAATVKNTYQAKEKFAQNYDGQKNYEAVRLEEYMAPSTFGLQSAVCDTCYYLLKDKKDFDNTVYTTYNKVFRNESSQIDSLDRLKNFSVRDIMFVGEKDFVYSMLRELTGEFIGFIETFKICGKIEAANDPFFVNESLYKNIFQATSRLKYEMLAYIPFLDSHLAIGSINNHLDFFGKAFNIRLPDGKYAHSGCVGVGFERLVYSLYCQYGHNAAAWPKDLKKEIDIEE